jgi:hypothetical protein
MNHAVDDLGDNTLNSLAAAAREAGARPDYRSFASCLGCGYLLRELPAPRCPECGRPFDPHDPDTMRVPGYRKPKPVRSPAPFQTEVLKLAWFATIAMLIGRLIAAPFALSLGGLIWGALAFVMVLHWTVHRQRFLSPLLRYHRNLTRVLLVVSLLLSVRYHWCPHATTVWVGPVGIAHSPNGGPCHNAPPNGGRSISGNWYFAY